MPDKRTTAYGPTQAGAHEAVPSPVSAKSTQPPAALRVVKAPATATAAAADRTPSRGGARTRSVPIAVLADDPLTGQGVVAHLRDRAEVRVLSTKERCEAEVVLIVVDRITEDTLKLMERFAQESVNEDARFVLVGDGVREQHVLRAVTCGLVSVIPRCEADFDRVLRAILDVREGRLEMPSAALGWLVGQLHTIHQDVLEPNGLTVSGLATREVDVLGLLAEGMSTLEISQRLSYSERTVKNIIHGVLTRLNLKNRTQAVAFAVRTGAL